MAHSRKFVPGGVDLVGVRLKTSRYSLGIQDTIEKIIIDSKILEIAPFTWVGLIYRYGIKNVLKPEFQRINKKYGDLSIAVELDTNVLKWADEYNLGLLKNIYMIAGLEALLHVCDKYKLPKDLILAERAKYGDIPNTIEECEAIYGREEKN